jgi:prenyl protein peptidase
VSSILQPRITKLEGVVGVAAHIHRYWELVHQEKHDKGTAAVIVGIQLCYTTVFGWYATFLFLRTGHLMAPLVAHVFCNVMGLPALGQAFTAPYGPGLLLSL